MPTSAIQPNAAMKEASTELRRVRHCVGCGKPLIAEPVLTCKECGHEIRLRCFAYQAGRDRFIAECVDLDILAEGKTRVEAIGALQEAMYGYLATVIDGQDTEGLIPRRAPLSHRLRYHFESFRDTIHGLFDRKHAQSVISCRYEVKDGQLVDCR